MEGEEKKTKMKWKMKRRESIGKRNRKRTKRRMGIRENEEGGGRE